ncbi:antichymotrypsin-2 [Drosophila guanche]|uniref:Blast:Antichymotrypsin-2 n=1 Tax=Drosophila guanche TaxID=7266 RepID=A0A3B0IYR8_DROGU|nr:antichymotrypsin-2 [Drosophila guanche]SPP73105.1 blast:Antichymotrypsin-2 [Drosophila guanche]
MSNKQYWRRLPLAALLAIQLLAVVGAASGSPGSATASASNYRFGLRLSARLGRSQPSVNVAVSPILVQAALGLLYAGTEPDSAAARELREALDLPHASSARQSLAGLRELLSELKQSSAVGCRLRLLSDFYTLQRFTFNFRDEFQALAAQMGVGSHRLEWESPASAAQAINYDFLTRSNFSVGELVSAAQLEAIAEHDTPFLHVSAVTFRAPWAQSFDPDETQRINFFSEGQRPKLVDAMFGQHRFRYAEIAALDAQLIELPFAVAELRLLLILPNRADGLPELEQQLAKYDLQYLRGQMSERKVALTLPKFQVLVHSQLSKVLKELGLTRLFTAEAQLGEVFSSLLASSAPHLGEMSQSTLLELQEAGGSASDSFSFGDLFRRALPLAINHPFFYAIGNDKSLLLAGHIVDI